MGQLPVIQADIDLLERLQSVTDANDVGGTILHEEGLQMIAAYRLALTEALKNPKLHSDWRYEMRVNGKRQIFLVEVPASGAREVGVGRVGVGRAMPVGLKRMDA